jgi:serine/threonine protein kinase
MNATNFTCKSIESSFGLQDFHNSTLTFFFGAIQIVASLVVLLYLYCHGHCRCATAPSPSASSSLSDTAQQSHQSFVESTVAHRNAQLVLPVYTYCLWGVALADCLQGIFNVIFPVKPEGGNPIWPTSILFGTAYGMYHFVLEGIAFLLAQQGVGRFSLRKAFVLATLWGFVTFLVQFIAFSMKAKTELHFAATLCWEALMFLFYFTLAYWPIRWFPHRCCHRRPALRHIYAPFWSLVRAISCTAIVLQMYGLDLGICLYDFGVLLPFAICKPVVVYFTLRSDSRFWMGLGNQNHPLQRPLMGSNLGANSARELASQLDTSTTRGVRMLHPSLLHLNKDDGSDRASGSATRRKNSILGIGGSARVIRATYHGRPVAAKLLFLPELTPNHVRSLCNEASLLSSVQSDHVLRIHGLVVRPPSIFLISDVAAYGSLFDLLHVGSNNNTHRYRTSSRDSTKSTTSTTSSASDFEHFDIQSKKSLLFRLHCAIGCAESVQILHQQCPAVVHGDIKGQNFLLHNDFMVKIADLELASRCLQGVSRINSRSSLGREGDGRNGSGTSGGGSGGGGGGGSVGGHGTGLGDNGNHRNENDTIDIRMVNDRNHYGSTKFSKRSMEEMRRLSQSLDPDDPQYRISETFNWLAPEVIDGHRNSPSSDIYSLGMTLYEVFTDTVPFHDLQLSSKFDSDKLKHAICTQGVRPGTVNGNNNRNNNRNSTNRGGSDDLHAIDALLARMWSQDRSERPDSATVVSSLRAITCKLLFGELLFTHCGEGDCNDIVNYPLYQKIETSELSAAVLDASPPFRVKYVSATWQKEMGWSSNNIVNKTLFECLRGPKTNNTRTRNLKTALALGDFFVSGCVHYDGNGDPLLHVFSITPLAGSRPLVLLRSVSMSL